MKGFTTTLPICNKQDRLSSRGVSAIEGLFGTVNAAGADLSALVGQALRDPNPITRRLAFSRLLESLTPGNAGAVREQLVALGADPDQWRDFHYAWGALDGKAAYANAAQSPESDLNATMSGWAAANPGEALAMLDNLPPELPGQRDELVASVVSGLSHNDSGSATAYVLRLAQEGNPKAGLLMETVATGAVRHMGPEAASRWAESLADGPLKGNAMAKVAEAYVRQDPQTAIAWAKDIDDPALRESSLTRAGQAFYRRDPEGALAWLEGSGLSGEARQRVTTSERRR